MAKRGSKRGSPSPPTYPDAALTLAGQRRAVWEGRARKTRGGLTRDDLMVSKSTGKIVSKRASRASKRAFARNGLRPDRNIAFRGAGATDRRTEVESAEETDWEALLRDA